MKFLALIQLYEEHVKYVNLRKWLEEKGGLDEAVFDTPDGVKIIESGIPFGGKYGLVLFYTAETEKQSFYFLKEFEPYGRVERYLTYPCAVCENTKALQKEME